MISGRFSQAQTVSDTLTVNTSAGTISHPINFQVADSPTAGITRLSLVGKTLTLIPGATSSLSFKNTGTATINTPELQLPNYLASIVTNATLSYKGDVTPGQEVIFKFDIPESFTFTNAQLTDLEQVNEDPNNSPIQLVSANTEAATPTLRIFRAISANSVIITAPNQSSGDTQSITVANNSDVAILISDVSTANLPAGVTIASNNDHCLNQVLLAGGSCKINLTSSVNAFGGGSVGISYAPQAASHNVTELAPEVSVAKTSISFLTDTLHLKQNIPTAVTITNMGNFTWQLGNSSFSVAKNTTGPAINDQLSISANNCNAVSTLAPAQTCQLTLSATHDSTAGAYDLAFNAGTSNTSNLTKTFQVDQSQSTLVLALDDDWNGQGIGLKRFIVTNDADDSLKPLDNLTFSLQQNASKLTSNSSALSFTSGEDACTADSALAGDQTCYLYVKAANDQALGPQNDWRIHVSAGSQSQQFDLNYDQYLYLAGVFYIETGEDSYYLPVYRYDGTNWSSLSTASNGGEFNSSIFKLAVSPRTGNLYAGGNFTNETPWTLGQGYYLAMYNGQSWQDLGQGPGTEQAPAFNRSLYAISFDQDNNVYVGGRFTNGENWQSGNYYIAKYSSGSWSSLGAGTQSNPLTDIVRSIVFDQHDNFYVNNRHNLAYYNQQTQAWQNLDTGLYFSRDLLFDTNDNSLYAADWSYNTFQYKDDQIYNRGVISTLSDPSGGPVYYMAMYQNKLYRLVLDWLPEEGRNPYHFAHTWHRHSSW